VTDTRTAIRVAMSPVDAKLQPPTPARGMIVRETLVRRLTAPDGPPVVSVIAPPGYGKTTLLVQAAAREQRPVAWLTLDSLDNDPAIMLSNLISAMDHLGPISRSVQAGLAAPSERILATVVPRLTSALHRWDQPVVIVLDDVQHLVDRTSLDSLTALIDHLPGGFRILLAGRSEPDLPLARLRVQRQLLEIGVRDLALDEHETGALAAAAGAELTPVEARTLMTRTEGWAAGIYLAALARVRGDISPDAPLSVSGSDHFVAAYLRSEIERDMDNTDVALLTRTSILDTVSPTAAAAVSGLDDAGERLRALAHGNLLIGEVGRDDASYRYHNLLREFLVAELERREPGAARSLHRRAASFFERAGNIDLAVAHAAAGGDEDTAARLVTAAGLSTFRSGQSGVIDRWMRGFAPDVFERHPSLAVLAAWFAFLNGRAEITDRLADIAERTTYTGPSGDGSASFESQRAMVRAIMARRGPQDVLANARLAVEAEGPASPWRPITLWILGSAHYLLGDVGAAEAAFVEADMTDERTSGVSMAILAKRAGIAMANGDWPAAEEFAARAHRMMVTGQHDEIVVTLVVHAVSARVAAHRGDVAGAREALVRAQLVRPMATHVVPWFAVDALLECARAYMAIGDHAGAQVVIREAEHIIRRRPELGSLTVELLDVRRRLASAATTLAGASSLTGAELRLLPLLPTYLSFQEIGDRLVISRHTVKTQAMSIYGKLQASSRGEAVERAIELGLLEPFYGLDLTRRSRPD